MQSLLLQLLLLLEVAAPGIEALIPAADAGAPLEVHAVAEEGVQLPQLRDPLVLVGVLVERLVLLCRSFIQQLIDRQKYQWESL